MTLLEKAQQLSSTGPKGAVDPEKMALALAVVRGDISLVAATKALGGSVNQSYPALFSALRRGIAEGMLTITEVAK